MSVYNWRDGMTKRSAIVFDRATGEVIPFVFYVDEGVNGGLDHVGRFQPAPDGKAIVLAPATAPGGRRPVEVWEFRRVRIEWADAADAPHVVAAG